MATNRGGGPRRLPTPEIDPTKTREMIGLYLASDPQPFAWDVYNGLKPSQAASGPGLLRTLPFVRRWLPICPACQIQSKPFSQILDSLVQAGSLSRFVGGDPIWEGLSPYDSQQRFFWAQKQAAKAVVVLYHLRRLKTNSVKRAQALASLTSRNRADVEAVLAQIVVPKMKKHRQGVELSGQHKTPPK